MWRAKDSPASLCGYAEFASAERICYVCFARNSIEGLVELASVVPGPMGANQVVEWLMFASPCEDGLFFSHLGRGKRVGRSLVHINKYMQ